jgi:hypothetical protein
MGGGSAGIAKKFGWANDDVSRGATPSEAMWRPSAGGWTVSNARAGPGVLHRKPSQLLVAKVRGKGQMGRKGRRAAKSAGVPRAQKAAVQKAIRDAAEIKKVPVALASGVVDLLSIQRAVTDGARIGRKVTLEWIEVRGVIYGNTTSTWGRLSIIQWFPYSVPTTALVFQDNTKTESPFNEVSLRDKFSVLKDVFTGVRLCVPRFISVRLFAFGLFCHCVCVCVWQWETDFGWQLPLDDANSRYAVNFVITNFPRRTVQWQYEASGATSTATPASSKPYAVFIAATNGNIYGQACTYYTDS